MPSRGDRDASSSSRRRDDDDDFDDETKEEEETKIRETEKKKKPRRGRRRSENENVTRESRTSARFSQRHDSLLDVVVLLEECSLSFWFVLSRERERERAFL